MTTFWQEYKQIFIDVAPLVAALGTIIVAVIGIAAIGIWLLEM